MNLSHGSVDAYLASRRMDEERLRAELESAVLPEKVRAANRKYTLAGGDQALASSPHR